MGRLQEAINTVCLTQAMGSQASDRMLVMFLTMLSLQFHAVFFYVCCYADFKLPVFLPAIFLNACLFI